MQIPYTGDLTVHRAQHRRDLLRTEHRTAANAEDGTMQFAEAFKLALQSLWANKMRTVLTLIGVVMGVASVIMVITLVKAPTTT